MRARWDSSGRVGAGALHLAMGRTPQAFFRPVDAGVAVYRDLYWRIFVKLQPGWRGGGAGKTTRAIRFAFRGWGGGMGAHVWGGEPQRAGEGYLPPDPPPRGEPVGGLPTTNYNAVDHPPW